MLEEKWGVSAAAPVAVAAAAGEGDSAAAADDKDSFDVVLTGFGDKKINVIKEVPISKISLLSSDKWLTFFDKYGLHDTKCFRDLLKIFLTHLDYCEKITFMEFYEKTRIDLVFTTFCLNTDSLEVLNYEKTPDLKLLDGL